MSSPEQRYGKDYFPGPTKTPTMLGQAIKSSLYDARTRIERFTGRQLPLPIFPESWRWGQVKARYKDYDRTFGIDSVDEMRKWYSLHPQEKEAILELAGYGIAPNALSQALRDKHIGGDKISYGIALARELSPDFSTPYAELVAGNLGEIALKDASNVTNMLKKKLQDNGCSQGAALIYLRPVGAYPFIERENGVTKETALDFYTKMSTRISRELLSYDGKFFFQIPESIVDKNAFLQSLRLEFGNDFTVSNYRKSDFAYLGWYCTSSFRMCFRFSTLTIQRNTIV